MQISETPSFSALSSPWGLTLTFWLPVFYGTKVTVTVSVLSAASASKKETEGRPSFLLAGSSEAKSFSKSRSISQWTELNHVPLSLKSSFTCDYSIYILMMVKPIIIQPAGEILCITCSRPSWTMISTVTSGRWTCVLIRSLHIKVFKSLVYHLILLGDTRDTHTTCCQYWAWHKRQRVNGVRG